MLALAVHGDRLVALIRRLHHLIALPLTLVLVVEAGLVHLVALIFSPAGDLDELSVMLQVNFFGGITSLIEVSAFVCLIALLAADGADVVSVHEKVGHHLLFASRGSFI